MTADRKRMMHRFSLKLTKASAIAKRGQDGEAKRGPDSQINRDRRARNLSRETVRCNPAGRRIQHDSHVRTIPNFKTEFETKANLTQANAIKTKRIDAENAVFPV